MYTLLYIYFFYINNFIYTFIRLFIPFLMVLFTQNKLKIDLLCIPRASVSIGVTFGGVSCCVFGGQKRPTSSRSD